MNRIIKFRAVYKGKMELINGYGSANEGVFELDTKLDSPLMQFTGLTDKNGKDVFEGDIIQITLELTAFPNQGRAEVKWDGNGFWVFNDNSQKTWYKSEYIEVIGNKFENPELLTQRGDSNPL